MFLRAFAPCLKRLYIIIHFHKKVSALSEQQDIGPGCSLLLVGILLVKASWNVVFNKSAAFAC